jgi:drug/metabolite transporter (DMT)-like permease
MDQRMALQDWLLLMVLSVLWGGSFFFVAVARPELPPLTLVAARVALAAAMLAGVPRLAGVAFPAGRAAWRACLGMGVLNNAIPFSLIAWAQGTLPSGVAAILNATTPLFTVLVAHALTRDERLNRSKGAGVLLGFLGVAVLMGWAALGEFSGRLPEFAMLGATFSYALAGVWGRRLRRLGVAPAAGALGQLLCSAAIMLVLAGLLEQPWRLALPGPRALAAVLGLALFSTALAYLIFFRVLARAGATSLSLVTFMIPASAILLGTLFLDEVLLPRHLAGMALIGLGLLCLNGSLLRRG